MEVVEVEDTLVVVGMKEAVLVVGMEVVEVEDTLVVGTVVVEGVIEVVVRGRLLKEYRT
jgi:hypothetical protein